MSNGGKARTRLMLKREALDAMAEPLGLKTIADKARFVDINETIFHRIYSGQRGAGGPNVQRIINAPWPTPVTFDALFELVEGEVATTR